MQENNIKQHNIMKNMNIQKYKKKHIKEHSTNYQTNENKINSNKRLDTKSNKTT